MWIELGYLKKLGIPSEWGDRRGADERERDSSQTWVAWVATR